MLALATALPSFASLRPYGCLPLRVAVRDRYRGGEHQDRAARGFEAACGLHRTGNKLFNLERALIPIQRLPAQASSLSDDNQAHPVKRPRARQSNERENTVQPNRTGQRMTVAMPASWNEPDIFSDRTAAAS
jgi:hypothetical protein